MKKSLFVLALLAPALALFTGCSTYDHGAYLPVKTSVNNVENLAGFVLLDPGAQHSITCPGIQETPLPDGRLQVQANLRNRENRRLQVQANCVFKNAEGFQVEETPFQTVFLDENSMGSVQFVSMTPGAVRYTIRIRQAR